MALRMEPFVASPTGSIGRRISSLPRPSSASPHLAPAKPGFEKDRVVQRHEPVLHLQRAGVIAVEALTLQLGAEPRRHVRHHRDAAVAAGRVVGERGHVLAGELDEIGAHGVPLLRDAGEIGGRVLDAGDVRQFVEPRHGRHRHVDHRARRDIVDDDGDADGVVDRLEMPVKPLLARLVVIGRDDEQGIGAGFFRMAGERDRLGGVVGAGAGDHRHAAARRVDAPFHHLLVLVMGQGRAFAGRPDRHEAVGAVLDLPFDMGAEGLLVDGAVLERRHQSGERAPQPPIASHDGRSLR